MVRHPRRGYVARLFAPPPPRRCQGCQWRIDTMPFRDAAGGVFHLCPDCMPAATAEKRAELARRQLARDARIRETRGQIRLEGTGDAARVPDPPIELF